MIKDIVEKYLPAISEEETAADLGNRSTYIGASDISGCPRKAVLNKIQQCEHSIETLMVFQRGHIAETIINKTLKKSGAKYTAQYEAFRIVDGKKDERIKAHLDFLVNNDKEKTVTVVECKSATAVTQPYETWVNQTIFQMGLVRQIIKISPTPDIEVKGEILVIDLKSGQFVEFGVKFNQEIFNILMFKAEYILDCLKHQDEINIDELDTETSILCGYCNYKDDCPTYNRSDEIPDDLKGYISEYAQLNIVSKDIDKQKGILKDNVLGYGKAFKVTFDGIKASVTVSNISSFDTRSFKKDEPELVAAYSHDKKVVRFLVS